MTADRFSAACLQREGDVVHLVAHHLADLSADLASVGHRERSFPLPHGRGDEFHRGGSGRDAREPKARNLGVRDIYVRDLHIDAMKVKTRDFR